jgi:hypothetical protein
MIKARLFHLVVVCCFVAFALTSLLAFLPDGMYDGAD